MKYELRENHGIPAPLLALMAVATGLSVANCYYNQHGCDIDPDRLCSRTCVCHSAWRFGFTKAADIDQLYHFIVRIACHSPFPGHLLGMGCILACRSVFGHAAVLHPVGVLSFSTRTQGAQRGDYTVLSANRHSWFTGIQWLSR